MPTGPRICLGDVSRVEQPLQRLKDQARGFDVLPDAHADGFEHPGLHAAGRLGELNAQEATVPASFRRGLDLVAPILALDRDRDGLVRTLGDRVDQLGSKRHRLAVDGEDDVAGLDAGTIARLTRVHERRAWMHVREHANLADFEPAVGSRPSASPDASFRPRRART